MVFRVLDLRIGIERSEDLVHFSSCVFMACGSGFRV